MFWKIFSCYLVFGMVIALFIFFSERISTKEKIKKMLENQANAKITVFSYTWPATTWIKRIIFWPIDLYQIFKK